MKILFISDIVGSPGREIVKKLLPGIKEEHSPDLVLANAENLTHGNGFVPKHIAEMQEAGVDFFTSGNHTWDKREGVERLKDDSFPVIRPANFPSDKTPGRGFAIVKSGERGKVLVINLMGRVFMKADLDCPFRKIDEILEEMKGEDANAVFVDFHGETTAEKVAFAHYVQGRVSAVFGTHTHVPTADLRIIEGGTAFMTDVGMTGCLDSVIGVKKEIIIEKFLTQLPVKHEPAESGEKVLNAAMVEVDEESKKAFNVVRIQKFI